MNSNGEEPLGGLGSHLIAANRSRAHLSVVISGKAFSISSENHLILQEIRFEVGEGEFLCLLGQSGCGKTTLLRLIAGLDADFDGVITMDGSQIRGPDQTRGMVFQEARLFPWMTVAENVAFAVPGNTPLFEKKRRIDESLSMVDILKYKNAWPHQLSGGIEKRVGLARALVNLPKILLLDEPFSALDTLTKFSLQDELARIHTASRLTTILVTHDLDEALYLSDRIIVLSSAPARIKEVYSVGFPRPRSRIDMLSSEIRATLYNDLVT